MAASLKISELNELTGLADDDLFLVTDTSATTSKKVSYLNLKNGFSANTAAVLGVSATDSNLGTFTGSAVADNITVKAALQAIATKIDAKQSLLGVSTEVAHLGTFTGSTISDSANIKAALQSLETATELRATTASPAFTGNLITHIGDALLPVVHRIQGGFPDVTLRTNGADVDLNQNEGRILWEDAGGGAVGAIKMTMLPAAPMRFFTKNITAAEEKMRITTDGRVGIGKTIPLAKLHVDGSVIVEADFPDFDLRSGGERRIIFQDAGGGAEAAIKSDGANMDIFIGGVTAADRVADFDSTGLTLDTGKTLTLEGTAITATGAELNFVDGVTSNIQTQLDSKLASGSFSQAALHIDDIHTALGIASEATNFGTFTGSTISDNVTIKAAVQALETATELRATSAAPTLTGTVDIDGQGTLKKDSDDFEIDLSGTTGELKIGTRLVSSHSMKLGTVGFQTMLQGIIALNNANSEFKIQNSNRIYVEATDIVLDNGGVVKVSDNNAAALDILEGTNSYLKLVTPNGSEKVAIGTNLTVAGNLTVTGTTTTVDTVTMEAANAVVFEGATADDHETTLTIIDPDGDRTIKLPNQSGCLPVLAADSSVAITATPAELNVLDGITATVAELNILTGYQPTAELNIPDGVTYRTESLMELQQP